MQFPTGKVNKHMKMLLMPDTCILLTASIHYEDAYYALGENG